MLEVNAADHRSMYSVLVSRKRWIRINPCSNCTPKSSLMFSLSLSPPLSPPSHSISISASRLPSSTSCFSSNVVTHSRACQCMQMCALVHCGEVAFLCNDSCRSTALSAWGFQLWQAGPWNMATISTSSRLSQQPMRIAEPRTWRTAWAVRYNREPCKT